MGNSVLAPANVTKALLLLGALFVLPFAGCITATDTVQTKVVRIGPNQYEVWNEFEVGPGEGIWVGQVQAADNVSFAAFLEGEKDALALSSIMAGSLDSGLRPVAGDPFATDSQRPLESGSGEKERWRFGGDYVSRCPVQMVAVAWAGLDAVHTVEIGLPKEAEITQDWSSEGGYILAPWTMGDDTGLRQQGEATYSGHGPGLFIGNVAMGLYGSGEVILESGGQQETWHLSSVSDGYTPWISSFWEGSEVRAEYEVLGVGNRLGLYGALIEFPAESLPYLTQPNSSC